MCIALPTIRFHSGLRAVERTIEVQATTACWARAVLCRLSFVKPMCFSGRLVVSPPAHFPYNEVGQWGCDTFDFIVYLTVLLYAWSMLCFLSGNYQWRYDITITIEIDFLHFSTYRKTTIEKMILANSCHPPEQNTRTSL